ncbi:MAG: LysR family transcriptional regulator [Acidobacteriaceae bacterium]|nr:LysR family transcriptional regulator [Acidobacteriaceae bacterium]
MELRHLRYFCAAAEQGSFSKASRTLYISQSSISEQIADLEREIGVTLFIRDGRSTVLTAAGEIFLVEARTVLEAARHAIEIAQGAERGEIGTLRIGFFAGSIGTNFTKIVRRFRRDYPGVRLSLFEMTPTQQWQALVEGRIDLGFTRRLEPQYRDHLAFETIRQDQIVAVLPKDHPLVPGPVNVCDLAAEPFVLSSRETSPSVFDKVIELCSEAGFSPKIASISSVWSSVVLMVQAGEGVSLLPLNHQQSRANDLAFCPLTAKDAYVDLIIAWSPRRDSTIMRSFRGLAEAMRRS